MKRTVLLVVAVVVLAAAGSSFYVVDETQQVVITMFGRAVGGPVKTPGLKVKMPFFVHKPNYFPKNLLEWDGDPGQVPTRDKTFIWVDTFARWRIVDPLMYFENVNNETNAHRTLDGIIDAAVRNLVTSNHLIETVRNTNRPMDLSESGLGDTAEVLAWELKMGREAICKEILAQAHPKLAEVGIELVDVRFKRINYVDDVLQKVYERMIAERRQIAEKYRSEGKGESQKIAGEKEKELKRIFSEAYREAETVKGEADAEAANIYAAAYGRDPEFYSFAKTLSIYAESLDSTTSAILSTDNDFLKYLKDYAVRR
jgi:membrane protease subunit HflC